MGKSKAAKPTRGQKILIEKSGLIRKNWLVLEETEKELVLVSRGSGRTRRIYKEGKR